MRPNRRILICTRNAGITVDRIAIRRTINASFVRGCIDRVGLPATFDDVASSETVDNIVTIRRVDTVVPDIAVDYISVQLWIESAGKSENMRVSIDTLQITKDKIRFGCSATASGR